MSKKLQILLASVSIIGLAVMFGCSTVMDAITPCEIEQNVSDYTNQPLKKYLPFTTLLDSKRITAWLDYKHQQNQVLYGRQIEDDNYLYGFIKDRQTYHQQGAFAFQEAVFTPKGAIGLLFPALFSGTLGAMFVPRLREKDKIKKAVEKAKNNK